MSIKAALRKARRLVESGWCQGGAVRTGTDGKKYYCASEAIVIVTGEFPSPAYLHLCETIGCEPKGVGAWQDQRSITKNDVLAMFDKAIETASN